MISPETLATLARILAGLEAEKPWEPVIISNQGGFAEIATPHPHRALWLAMTEPCDYHTTVEGFEAVCVGGRVSLDGQVHFPHDGEGSCHGTGRTLYDTSNLTDGMVKGWLLELLMALPPNPTASDALAEGMWQEIEAMLAALEQAVKETK
jgi:hypothetical protein